MQCDLDFQVAIPRTEADEPNRAPSCARTVPEGVCKTIDSGLIKSFHFRTNVGVRPVMKNSGVNREHADSSHRSSLAQARWVSFIFHGTLGGGIAVRLHNFSVSPAVIGNTRGKLLPSGYISGLRDQLRPDQSSGMAVGPCEVTRTVGGNRAEHLLYRARSSDYKSNPEALRGSTARLHWVYQPTRVGLCCQSVQRPVHSVVGSLNL